MLASAMLTNALADQPGNLPGNGNTPDHAPNNNGRAVALAKLEELKAINSNRQGAISDIIADWEGTPATSADTEGWLVDIEYALNHASNDDLLRIKQADSYADVRAILLGDEGLSILSSNDGVNIDALGDSTKDLQFTPVFPCRIFDSRPWKGGQGGYGDADETVAYYVHGNAGDIGPQGGNPAGCPAPKGDPSAISLNLTAVPLNDNQTIVSKNGHITPYPFGGSLPAKGSLVNFYPGTNIANSGIVVVNPLAGKDLNISHHNFVQSLGDVSGYFYPSNASVVSNWGFIISPLVDDFVYRFMGPVATIDVPQNDVAVSWNVTVAIGTLSGAGGLDTAPCYRAVGSAAVPTIIGLEIWGQSMLGTQRLDLSINGSVIPGTGQFDFGMCYRTSSQNWNSNDVGYVTAETL